MGAGANLAAIAADDLVVVTAIVVARLALPLLIPRIPLIILAALALDGIDNSLLAHLTSSIWGRAARIRAPTRRSTSTT